MHFILVGSVLKPSAMSVTPKNGTVYLASVTVEGKVNIYTFVQEINHSNIMFFLHDTIYQYVISMVDHPFNPTKMDVSVDSN